MSNAYTAKEFFIHQPSDVEFQYVGYGDYVALLDDTWSLPLDPRDNIVGQLKLGVDQNLIKPELTAGRFFIVDDQIVDYRFEREFKFLHTNDSIKALVDHLGFCNHGGVDRPRLIARNMTDRFECNATNTIGGQFDIDIGFTWSPFNVDIHSILEMWRQVCENGAVAKSPLLHHKIPMLSNWEESLKVCNEVIRHNFDRIVLPRLEVMPVERINLADVTTIQRLVSDLLGSTHLERDSVDRLNTIYDQLEGVWTSEASQVKSTMQKFIAAPVSSYDAFNIVTEIGTHHIGRDRTAVKAQAFANHLIFNQDRQRNLLTNLEGLVVDEQTFNCPDRAFFGETCH